MCVGKEVCAVLFFIHLFQAFSHLVELYLESGKEWIVIVFAAMMFRKARMLVRNVFALVVRFLSFVPGVCWLFYFFKDRHTGCLIFFRDFFFSSVQFSSISSVCVLLCFIKLILGNRYGTGA